MTRDWQRRIRGGLGDPHVALALAVVVAVVVIVSALGTDPLVVAIPGGAYLAIQIALGRRSAVAPSLILDTARLLIALAAIFGMSLATGDAASLPLILLGVPVVVLAASIGNRTGILVGLVALAGAIALAGQFLSPDDLSAGILHRGIALIAATMVLSIGTRRTVEALERAAAHAQQAAETERRRSGQMAAVEAIGRLLAQDRPTEDALDAVVDLLATRFDYRYVAIHTLDGSLMHVAAQRGYDGQITTFDATSGVVGRVLRTGEAELVRDVLSDPDYRAASPDVRSEVCVPLQAGDVLLGVLNVESGVGSPALDEHDREALVVIGDRLAASMALTMERGAILARAALFTRLAAFGTAVNASLEQSTAYASIVRGVAAALEADIVTLVLRDSAAGEDRIVAIDGGDARYVGVRLPAGQGMTSAAMTERRVVSTAALARADFPTTVRGAETADVLAVAVMPLIHEQEVIGAVSLSRTDLGRPFTPLELEAMPLVASQVALALTNVSLHQRVADAAIRDPLTGLWNRRHLEVALDRLFAARERHDPEQRHPVAAIMFDLDHFGLFNKRHGHQVGDGVLRAFGAILSSRLRSSDIVARYGGEEFVAILDGATVAEAQRVAEEIRRSLEAERIPGVDGAELRATVSAGCASVGPNVNSVQTLLEVADVALQMAKRGGRNQVVAA